MVRSAELGRRAYAAAFLNPMDEHTKLLEKIRRIEALHAGAATDGERNAAADALRRISERLHRSRFRIRQPSIASLSITSGRESSSWHYSGAMGCPVSLLATAPEHGHGANPPVLRQPTLARVRRAR